jgi:hypothetical protein
MNDDDIPITNAEELLHAGESALVVAVLKNEHLLFINPDGTGTTGNWSQSTSVSSDKVIIYLRKPRKSECEVWMGDFVSSKPSYEPDRVVVSFRNMHLTATTFSNWKEFSNQPHNWRRVNLVIQVK